METIVDSLFEEHKCLINRTIRRNRPLLSAIRLEDEDVAQELSITLFRAIGKFDPDRSQSLAAYIRSSLQYEILNIKRRYKPHGVTGIPVGFRPEFLCLDRVLPDGCSYELPVYDDTSGFERRRLYAKKPNQSNPGVDFPAQQVAARIPQSQRAYGIGRGI